MKKFVISLIAAAFGMSAAAQDIILLRNADEINATVVEITPDDVCYRNYGDKTGPLRRISRDKIVRITYANGEKETFSKPADNKATPAPTAAAKPSSGFVTEDGYPYPTVRHKYSVGDLFDEDGVKGIVVAVTADRVHGLIMSLEYTKTRFMDDRIDIDTFAYPDGRLICDSPNDGWKNQCAMEKFVNESEHYTLADFPAFEWCHNRGKGWYLPSKEELKALSWASIHSETPKSPRQWQRTTGWIYNTLKSYGIKLKQAEILSWFMIGSSTEASEKRRFFLNSDWFLNTKSHIVYKKANNKVGYIMDIDKKITYIPAVDGLDKRIITAVFAFHKF